MITLETWKGTRYVIAGTGSRSWATRSEAHQNATLGRLERIIVGTQERHPEGVALLSGGAEGWDEAVAMTAHKLGVPYALALPNVGYLAHYWGKASVLGEDRTSEANLMLDRAEFVEYTTEWWNVGAHEVYVNGTHTNFLRNERMVNVADGFVVYGPGSSGTQDCVRRIKLVGKPFRIIEGA